MSSIFGLGGGLIGGPVGSGVGIVGGSIAGNVLEEVIGDWIRGQDPSISSKEAQEMLDEIGIDIVAPGVFKIAGKTITGLGSRFLQWFTGGRVAAAAGTVSDLLKGTLLQGGESLAKLAAQTLGKPVGTAKFLNMVGKSKLWTLAFERGKQQVLRDGYNNAWKEALDKLIGRVAGDTSSQKFIGRSISKAREKFGQTVSNQDVISELKAIRNAIGKEGGEGLGKIDDLNTETKTVLISYVDDALTKWLKSAESKFRPYTSDVLSGARKATTQSLIQTGASEATGDKKITDNLINR